MGEVVHFPPERIVRLIENPAISQRLTRRSVIAGIIQSKVGGTDSGCIWAADAVIDFLINGKDEYETG